MGCFHLNNENEALNQNVQHLAAQFNLESDLNIETEKSGQGLYISFSKDSAKICYQRPVELFRGIGFIMQWLLEGKESMEYEEAPVFQHLTYMADCSRDAVLNIDFIKQLVHMLALMGYDRLMLYTEDTYEVEEYPFFGYMRGRYTKEELHLIDEYASGFGIELVPCIQTLAHLNALFRWGEFQEVRDTGDILCCGLEQTYDLIEAMIKTYAQTCRSRVINIGMDEAEMIGRGNYIHHFGYEKRYTIMEKHLKRVLEICKKYGFTCMMWSDMFFKTLTGGQYHEKGFTIPDEVKKSIPKEVELIYWDYYARDSEKYEEMLTQHKQLADSVAFAGGAWKWSGFAPLLNHSMMASKLALTACKNHAVQNVIVTGWGDGGCEASQASVLPILSLFAEYCHAQNENMDWLGSRLKACTGAVFEDFLKLDLLNLTPDNPSPGRLGAGTAKYLLYQDVLLGIYDPHVDEVQYAMHYRECAEVLSVIAEKPGPYGYLFETLAYLAKVLERKAGLGVCIKQAYDKKDMDELKRLMEKCTETIAHIEEFRKKFNAQWMAENKVFGFEVHDIRLGGLKERVLAARTRLSLYLEGKIERIEELEEVRLPLQKEGSGPPTEYEWAKMVTASVI